MLRTYIAPLQETTEKHRCKKRLSFLFIFLKFFNFLNVFEFSKFFILLNLLNSYIKRLLSDGCNMPAIGNSLRAIALKRCRAHYNLIIHSFIHARIYKAPLQEIYSEAPPAQPRRYRSVLSNLQNALSLFLGRRRISKGSPFQVEGVLY